MHTAKEIERYTKFLAKFGITGEEEVRAVRMFIHEAVCIAVQELKSLENGKGKDETHHDAA